jgi:hypothetical protein
MARYAAHVLQLGPPSARLKGTNPKSKNEIPSPNVSASKTAKNRKNGSCPAVGAMLPSAGGQIMGPVRKAGIANTKVTNRTLTQVFTMLLLLFRLSVLLVPIEVWQPEWSGTSPKWTIFVCQVAITGRELRRTP